MSANRRIIDNFGDGDKFQFKYVPSDIRSIFRLKEEIKNQHTFFSAGWIDV